MTLKMPRKSRGYISESLIYEVLDGQVIPYEGFRTVLKDLSKIENIKGSSGIQSYIIYLLMKWASAKFDKNYWILPNEAGFALDAQNRLSIDLALVAKDRLDFNELTNKLLNIAPDVVFEVDTKAAMEVIRHYDYYLKKTKKLLEAGCPLVVWFFTDTRQVMRATAHEPWTIVDWKDTVEVLGEELCLGEMMEG